ncbi:hypothetical protein, partial [Bacillus cereus group sp. BfR-BA-01314]|uniref:hypothetical protein n=2 Tax=unclassified Bacillus cereus group TaxID=2750818 RepID=UPI001F5685BE|nr:hypothetical protein [Bacillus cereus]
GLFDMPTFIKSIKDNKKLYKKNTFCLKISLKLMDVGYPPMPINLRKQIHPKRKKCALLLQVSTKFRFWGRCLLLA